MFDSFIFYSIWLYFDRNPTQKYVDSWISYLFEGRQIANLNTAVAAAKTGLNRPDYRMNVFLTVPVASNAVKTSAIAKNIDTVLSKWNKLNPKDLQLAGFYWGFSEGLSTNIDITKVVQESASYIHSRGLKMMIIPYRHAYGYQSLHTIGVDYATMQPNYAWYSDNDLSAFAKVDDSMKAGYVDGAEFELPVSSSSLQCCSGDWRINLKTYFEQAYAYKWNSRPLQAYYHGSDISSMGRQTGSDYRTAYEMIYQYILTTRVVSSTSTAPANSQLFPSIYRMLSIATKNWLN